MGTIRSSGCIVQLGEAVNGERHDLESEPSTWPMCSLQSANGRNGPGPASRGGNGARFPAGKAECRLGLDGVGNETIIIL